MRTVRLLCLGVVGLCVAQAGLVHSYTFDGNVNDQVGSANGSLFGTAAVGGGVLALDGGIGYADFLSHIVPTSGSYSVALDFRLNGSASGIEELISQGSSGGPGFYIGSSNSGGFRVTDSWGSPSGTFPANAGWHTVLLSVDATAGNSKFYLDGSLLDTLGFAISTTTGGSETRFGAQFGPHGEYFSGDIDNVRIYDSAVTAAELTGTPEPSTFLLGVAGLVVVFQARRRSA